MKTYRYGIIILNLLLVLAFFNYSIFKKEAILDKGKLILLELAPVDPRSLMQGDYMALQYQIAGNTSLNDIPKRGYIVVDLDDNGIARKIRLQEDVEPIEKGEFLIEYTQGKSGLNIGAESYFFQEGHAQKYERARYGGLKVDAWGNSVLVGLYDEDLEHIN
jgi:uncharacterized membrane-anchored protein